MGTHVRSVWQYRMFGSAEFHYIYISGALFTHVEDY